MPRYTATESQLTISPPNRSASASESAVFPLPVGPSRITTSGDPFSFSSDLIHRLRPAFSFPRSLVPAGPHGAVYARWWLVLTHRHHPVGKIHFGFVCQSHHRQIAAATISNPNTWLRRKTRVCSSRAAFSACCSLYGLMRVSTTLALALTRAPHRWRIPHQYRTLLRRFSQARMRRTGPIVRFL